MHQTYAESAAAHVAPASREANPRRLWDTPWLFWTLVALLLSLEYWCLGPSSFVRIHDNADGFLTRFAIAKRSLFSSGGSYWFPFMAGGMDRLSQDLPYTQFTSLIFFLFPNWFAYALVIVLQYFLSGYGAFRLCHNVLKLNQLSCILAGIGTAIFVNGLLDMQFGHCLFPFVIWALAKISTLSRFGRQFACVCLLGIGYGLACPLPFTLPFAIALGAAWFVLVTPQRSARFWALFAAFACTVFLPHAKSIWALLLNAPDSQRANRGFADLRSVFETLTYAPAFVWIFAFWVILAGIVIYRIKDRPFIGLASLYVFCWFGFVVLNLLKFVSHGHVAFINGFQVDRFYEFGPFFGAIATAYVIDAASRRRNAMGSAKAYRRSWVTALAAFCLVALIAKYNHLRTLVSLGNETYNFGNAQLRQLGENRPSGLDNIWRVATLPDVSLHPGYANAYGLETIDGYPNLYPKRFQLFWEAVIGPAAQRDPGIVNYFFDWGGRIYLFGAGHNPVHNPVAFRLDLLSLANTKYLISRYPVDDPELARISGPAHPPSTHFAAALRSGLFSSRKDLYLYLNREWMPRAFLVSKILAFPTLASLNAALSQSQLSELNSSVFVEDRFQSVLGAPQPGSQNGKLLLTTYLPDRIELSSETASPAVLVVSNTYSKFWQCEIDGVRAEIAPAYGVFWAVRVNAGKHRLVFRYTPPYSALG